MRTSTAAPAKARNAAKNAVVRPLPIARDDVALVQGLRAGEPWARAALFDRYSPLVERILVRILGQDLHTEVADFLHDAFVQAFASLDRLRDATALRAWMQTVAARTAYKAIRARRARRWLHFWEPERLPEVRVEGIDPVALEAYRRTYAILDELPAKQRIVFVLRHIEGMALEEIAAACEVSIATVKRRLAAADAGFVERARNDPTLVPWLKEGGRWLI